MTYRDFAFWLQGFFELSNTSQLSANSVSVIDKHLCMVLQDKSTAKITDTPYARDFCKYLETVFTLNQSMDKTGMDDKITTITKNKLREVFLKEIDPSMKDTDGKLQALHDGKETVSPTKPPYWNRPVGPNGELVRC